MEKFLESVIAYSLNLAVDNIYNCIQAELSKENSIVASVVSGLIETGYDKIKLDINQA